MARTRTDIETIVKEKLMEDKFNFMNIKMVPNRRTVKINAPMRVPMTEMAIRKGTCYERLHKGKID